MYSKDTDNKSVLEKYKSKKCNDDSRSLQLPDDIRDDMYVVTSESRQVMITSKVRQGMKSLGRWQFVGPRVFAGYVKFERFKIPLARIQAGKRGSVWRPWQRDSHKFITWHTNPCCKTNFHPRTIALKWNLKAESKSYKHILTSGRVRG